MSLSARVCYVILFDELRLIVNVSVHRALACGLRFE